MDPEFLAALSAMTAPVMWGKISLVRGLLIVIVFGIVIIALSLAYARIQGNEELEQLERRHKIVSQLDSYYSEAHCSRKEDAEVVLATIEPATVSCPISQLA